MSAFIINTFNTLCKSTSILFLAFLTLNFTYSPLQADTMVLDNGFESGNLSGFKCSGNCPKVTTSPIMKGKYAGNFELTRSMNTKFRTEAELTNGKGYFAFGQEYWVGFNYRYEDWVKDTSAEISPFQMHNRPSSWVTSCTFGDASYNPINMVSQNDEARIEVYRKKILWRGPLQKKQWLNIVLHFKISTGSDGFIEVWKDGVKLGRSDGPNQPKTDNCGKPMRSPYLKLGIYKWDWRSKTTQSSRRQLIIDNVKIAQGSSAYSMVSPSSSSSTGDTSTPPPSTDPTIEEDLVAYWPMNTGTSTTTPDVSGNGYTGILANGAQLTASGTLKLDGVNDYVNVGKPNVSGNAMTISAWIWADDLANCSSSDCRIISKAIGLAAQDHDFMISTVKVNSATRLRFRLNTSGATSTLTAASGNIQNKEWVHVAAVYDGKSMRIYQDGVLVGSKAKTGNITLRNTGSTWIGANPPTNQRRWKGQIDDVRIYNYALTSAEIAELAK